MARAPPGMGTYNRVTYLLVYLIQASILGLFKSHKAWNPSYYNFLIHTWFLFDLNTFYLNLKILFLLVIKIENQTLLLYNKNITAAEFVRLLNRILYTWCATPSRWHAGSLRQRLNRKSMGTLEDFHLKKKNSLYHSRERIQVLLCYIHQWLYNKSR